MAGQEPGNQPYIKHHWAGVFNYIFFLKSVQTYKKEFKHKSLLYYCIVLAVLIVELINISLKMYKLI